MAVPVAPPAAPPDPESQALGDLDAQHAADLARVHARGQWVVAQLSSKYAGITDEKQTAANGTHTFGNTDILAEFRGLQQRLAGSGATTVLLPSSDCGTGRSVQGHVLWVAFAVGDFRSASQVSSWCARQFPELRGTDLTNTCLPEILAPR